ncbi:diguanylate cyclase domain-containing protein [Actinoplanes sp. NPDC051494]|uniref:diguanylate cyclase domain-containing protein n=1 Tax=Actinoplanes sp. NPDC051494 TaxID=3363907 RepID=UPI00379DA73D
MAAPWPGPDSQLRLLNDLVEVTTRDIPSLENVLELIESRISEPCGLLAIAVFTLDPDDGSLRLAAARGAVAANDPMFAGRVFRVAAGAPPVRGGERTAIRLRMGGQTHGVLVLTGTGLDNLLPQVSSGIALQLAATLQVLAAERQHQDAAHATSTIRALFEKGTTAKSVEDAGQLLARATGDAFRTTRAAVHLVGPDGRISYVGGVGLSPEMNDELHRRMIGRLADESPVWRTARETGEPLLMDDTTRAEVRTGGFAHTMGLRSLIAMPLMSGGETVGMAICGDADGPRHWTGRDRTLARQMALEGALIIDGARMRQAEELHVAELTRQAYHDALTGLANRSHLLDRAEHELAVATAGGLRMALLLLDLDGFKRVNDTVGHHAGDALLQAVGHRMQASVRDHDIVARLGGDEFAILLTRNPDASSAVTIAERLHARVCESFAVDDVEIAVGASIGIALFPDDAAGIAALIRGADSAMYQAKRAGGGIKLA